MKAVELELSGTGSGVFVQGSKGSSRRPALLALLAVGSFSLPGCAVLGVAGQVAQGVVAALGVVRAVTMVAATPLAGPVRANLAPAPLAPAAPSSTSTPQTIAPAAPQAAGTPQFAPGPLTGTS